MLRKIIQIDQDKCVGCGLCAGACHQSAIGIVNGKARLLRDDYCDGLGNCLPVCPTGAITFEEREADAFNRAAVEEKQQQEAPRGCPGSQAGALQRGGSVAPAPAMAAQTQRNQWPVQIKLVPVEAPYWKNANLLIAADCCAYACGSFHPDYMRNRVTVIGCPKLDEGDYAEKLTEILKRNEIKSVTVARMEVPCCGGLERAAIAALQNCGKMIPWQVVTISTTGEILSQIDKT